MVTPKKNTIKKEAKKVEKAPVCRCPDAKIIADYRNDYLDPRGLVKKCPDCGKVTE